MQFPGSSALLALSCVLTCLLGACASNNEALWEAMDARAAEIAAANQTEPAEGVSVAETGAPTSDVQVAEAGMPRAMTAPVLPRSAAPSPAVAGLDFLAGRWVAVNPNRTVNEEVWTPPRGNVLIGSFRQIRLDGDCSFVELSQIASEGEEIVLRLRHLHGRLEVPEGKEAVSLFRLVSLTKDRVEFTGTAGTENVTSVTYERTGDRTLRQSIAFAPESGEKDFVTNYFLDQ